MAKWSVALFGHYKPEYYIIRNELWIQKIPYGVWVGGKYEIRIQEVRHDKRMVASFLADEFVEETDHFRVGDSTFLKADHYLHPCEGRIKRAIPGDVIAAKPVGQPWTSTEKKQFLILDIDDLEPAQSEAICEPEMDLDSYRPYDPMEYGAWLSMMQLKSLSKADPVKANALLEMDKEQWYQEYLIGCQEASAMPTDNWRKRRFNIDLVTLETAGADPSSMLNKELEYAPKLRTFYPNEVFDKLLERKIESTDKLEFQKPRTLEEMLNPKTGTEILSEIKT